MKRNDILIQFFWYLLVGGSAFVAEVAAFIAFMMMGLHWLPASITAFIVAQTVNYFLSYLLAFRRGRFGRTSEISRLLVVSLVGLVLNTGFVWLFITLGYLPLAAKIIAVPFVLGWNFIGRRLFVFHKDMPELTYKVTQSLTDRLRNWSRAIWNRPKPQVQAKRPDLERL